ncbi:protein mono-ADP-ribosyltransferase PARP12-like [Discoglossus pictus]
MIDEEDLEEGEIKEMGGIDIGQEIQKRKDITKERRHRREEGEHRRKRRKTESHMERSTGERKENETREKKEERGERENENEHRKEEGRKRGGENSDNKEERGERGNENRERKGENGERGNENRERKGENGERGNENRERKGGNGERGNENRERKGGNGERGNENRERKLGNGERGNENRERKGGNGERGNENRERKGENGERGNENRERKDYRIEREKENRKRKEVRGERGKGNRDRKEGGRKSGNERRDRKEENTKESANVRWKLCSSGGSMEIKELARSLGLTHEQMLKLVEEEKGQSLMVSVQDDKSMVVSRSAVRVCSEQTKKCPGDCEKLHLCRYYVLKSCNRTPCAFNHDIEHGLNLTVLKMYELEKMSIDELRPLLLQNDPSFLPEICQHYNKGKGEFGYCTYKTNCQKLHLCQYFLHGKCKYQWRCVKSHDFTDDDIVTKLRKWGVGDGLKPSLLEQIYRNASALWDSRDSLPKKKAVTSGKKDSLLPSGSDKSQSHMDSSEEICLYHIRKSCSFKDKCGKVHYHLPYRWQVQDSSHWKDMENMESIEDAYCNVNKTIWTMNMNFDTMTYKSQKVRRLSTPSSATKPPYYILTTDWLWYWMDEFNRWIEYGKENKMRQAADLCSADLEKTYQSDKAATLQFKAGTETYELRLKDMVQRNLKHGTERKVIRRPRFVSMEEVKRKKSRKPESSEVDSKSAPLHWDTAQIPDVGYKLVTLDQSSDEYNKVKDSFHASLRTVTILSIERIQNLALWEVYKWQKEQMKKKNGGTEVDERQLFHGTDDKLVDAICQQNFDWRICGTHGTMYGKGSYFARDASYSHTYSNQTFSKTRVMFMARVLVGDFTTGNSSYLRPPSKNLLTSSCFYDSCVDNLSKPSIFIIFEKHQIYPEYLIKYL